MRTHELRIGNYLEKSLKSGNGRILIDKIRCQDIVRVFEDIGSFNYEPIPITEQWLIDLGFTKPRSIIVEYAKNGLELYFITTDDFYQAELGNFTIDLKHVHQLQNLYFALTGEELTKLKP